MIVDLSVLVAILKKEANGRLYASLIDQTSRPRLSAATFLETAIVIDGRRDAVVSRGLDDFIRIAGLVIEPVTERQARIAREAYRDFGKGSGHPAGLNFGDCFAYALAKDLDEPLLFEGRDFAETDVTPAV